MQCILVKSDEFENSYSLLYNLLNPDNVAARSEAIISLVFFYLSKVLFSGFLQFKGNFVDARNDTKYHDLAPLMACFSEVSTSVANLGKGP